VNVLPAPVGPTMSRFWRAATTAGSTKTWFQSRNSAHDVFLHGPHVPPAAELTFLHCMIGPDALLVRDRGQHRHLMGKGAAHGTSLWPGAVGREDSHTRLWRATAAARFSESVRLGP
jgi:hypothetical protein